MPAYAIKALDFSVKVYDEQQEAEPIIRTVAPYTMTSVQRLFTLYQLCRHVERVGLGATW